MADKLKPVVAVNLPEELVAKMEEVKKDRAEDRDKSIDELVQQFCRHYVKVREMARWELANMDELNRSYVKDPNDWDDADAWDTEFKQTEEGKK